MLLFTRKSKNSMNLVTKVPDFFILDADSPVTRAQQPKARIKTKMKRQVYTNYSNPCRKYKNHVQLPSYSQNQSQFQFSLTPFGQLCVLQKVGKFILFQSRLIERQMHLKLADETIHSLTNEPIPILAFFGVYFVCSQYLNHLLKFSNIQSFNQRNKKMKNIDFNSVVFKKQVDKKAFWKSVFLKRQIRKQRSSYFLFDKEEKNYSFSESTIWEESDSPQITVDYFDFSFVQQ